MAILIDKKRCVNCGTCYDRCPEGAFGRDKAGEIYVKYPMECWLCGSCEMDCPVQALQVTYDRNSEPMILTGE